MLSILSLLCVLIIVNGRNGIDLSVETSHDTWKCLTTDFNITFANIRLYRSTGEVDKNAPSSLRYAEKFDLGGNLDGYMFPCISDSSYSISNNIICPTASQQVNEMVYYLKEHGISFEVKSTENQLGKLTVGRLWLDIEDEVPSKYFSSNISVNTEFLHEVVSELENQKINIGIYTTMTYWSNIMGNIEGYSSYPLWYPRYDGIDDMSFFVPFAGWEEVAIKQTNGNVGYCNITQVDSDYMI